MYQMKYVSGMLILCYKDPLLFMINRIVHGFWQSYGIKIGYGGNTGPSDGRDGSSSQGAPCCS